MCEGVRTQWRLMWPSATGDEAGCRWRSKPPSERELREWCEDFDPLRLRVEVRVILETKPKRATEFDHIFQEEAAKQ